MSFHLCLSLPFLALICYRFLGPIFSLLQYIALWCPILSDRISFYHMNGISSKSLHNWIVSQSGDGGGNALQANIHILLGVSWPLDTFPTFDSQERRPKIHMDLGTLQSHGLSDGCDASDGAGEGAAIGFYDQQGDLSEAWRLENSMVENMRRVLYTFMLRICIKKGMEDGDVEEWQGWESCGVSMFALYISAFYIILHSITHTHTYTYIYLYIYIQYIHIENRSAQALHASWDGSPKQQSPRRDTTQSSAFCGTLGCCGMTGLHVTIPCLLAPHLILPKTNALNLSNSCLLPKILRTTA